MRLMIPLFAMIAVRPEGGGCHPPAEAPSDPAAVVAHDGRIGVLGRSGGDGVTVDEIGVGTPADGRIEPGEVIVAIDGVDLSGPGGFTNLRMFARGVPGTEVGLRVANDQGERDVVLTRAPFDESVARRSGPLSVEALVDRAIRDAGAMDCLVAGAGDVAVGGDLGPYLRIDRVSGRSDDDAAECVGDHLRSDGVPLAGGHVGRFEWSAWRVDDHEAHSETSLPSDPFPFAVVDAAPGLSR